MTVWYSKSPSSDVVDFKTGITEEVYECCVHSVCGTGNVREEEADGV